MRMTVRRFSQKAYASNSSNAGLILIAGTKELKEERTTPNLKKVAPSSPCRQVYIGKFSQKCGHKDFRAKNEIHFISENLKFFEISDIIYT